MDLFKENLHPHGQCPLKGCTCNDPNRKHGGKEGLRRIARKKLKSQVREELNQVDVEVTEE